MIVNGSSLVTEHAKSSVPITVSSSLSGPDSITSASISTLTGTGNPKLAVVVPMPIVTQETAPAFCGSGGFMSQIVS